MRGLAAQARVHHGADAIQRHGAFRHVGAEDDLGRAGDFQRVGLGVRRQLAVQGPQAQAPARRHGLAALQAGADLRGAGQEDQRVPLQTLAIEAVQRAGDLKLDGPVVGPGQEGRLHGEGATLTPQHGCVQVGGHGAGIQGG